MILLKNSSIALSVFRRNSYPKSDFETKSGPPDSKRDGIFVYSTNGFETKFVCISSPDKKFVYEIRPRGAFRIRISSTSERTKFVSNFVYEIRIRIYSIHSYTKCTSETNFVYEILVWGRNAYEIRIKTIRFTDGNFVNF